ncbi:MAG: YbaN family protein [Saccharofermentanales bacterium]
MTIVIKWLLITSGTISLILGVTGIFLPVLPTTPFLLLAAFCYARSSRKLHDWLISRKHLGSYIHNYMEHRAIKKSVKVRAVIFLWVALILSMILVDNLYVRIILPLIGAAVTWHIASLKTIE